MSDAVYEAEESVVNKLIADRYKDMSRLLFNRAIYGMDDPHGISYTASSSATTEPKTLTPEMLENVIQRFSHKKRPLVGITAQPEFVTMIERQSLLIERELRAPTEPLSPIPFYGVPVYPVDGQKEMWKTWCDYEAMVAYLKEHEAK